ncbi:uncharacterized protein RAG0_15974 [Rhynchosporium agropyri]|uniref:Bacteriophage T5 Orf172 DNA-binding domain-containing protein n=1 Tax=Rhynchosporium agropyri TaxID=914238 RepID=A0A1E1LNC0_9HELO|nr:uncharacterized protein RAG0_15974 [Rhynchosporium agropyri]
MLVHCHQHRAGRPIGRRLEAWKLALPPGSADSSEPDAPLEQRIKNALGLLSVECIARSTKCTCKTRVGGQKVQNCERTLQELAKHDVYSDEAKLELLLKVLEWNGTCSTHQSSRQFTWIEAWKKSIIAVLPLPELVVGRAITNNARNKPHTPPGHRTDPCSAAPTGLIGPHTSLGVDLASYWPKAHDTSPFDIFACARDLGPALLYKLIRSVIRRPLTAHDIHDGYVYAYGVEGNNGCIKIGHTTRLVRDRHDEWSFECNRQTKSLYPPPAAANVSNGVAATTPAARLVAAATAGLVPHARRIEALCHAELDHRRIKIYCGACPKQHIE